MTARDTTHRDQASTAPADDQQLQSSEPSTSSDNDIAAQSSGQDEMARLQAELAQASDRALRLQAELDNVRKRTSREIADERRYAGLPLIRDLFPVLDNIDRAVEAAERGHDTTSLLDGLKLVQQQLKTVLAQYGCSEIAALHQPFDPHLHEAISQMPSQDHAPGTVIAVHCVGHQLHGRVVRPSQVVVAIAPASQSPHTASMSEND